VPLGERFFELAGADLSDDSHLHAFRIATKRLRYALELAGPSIPPRQQRRIYESLSTLQDRLGEVRDHANAVVRLRDWVAAARKSPERRKLEKWLEHEEKSLSACRRGLRRWWSKKRQDELAQLWNAAVRIK
jgi:CHAD domain-containing protein